MGYERVELIVRASLDDHNDERTVAARRAWAQFAAAVREMALQSLEGARGVVNVDIEAEAPEASDVPTDDD